MRSLTANQLAAFLDARLNGDAATPFTAVFTDSRAPIAGGLFFALRGARFDGHDYLADVIAAGAGGVVVERGRAPANAPIALEVDDVQAALSRLGACLRRIHRGRFVAVTGSVGKTTVKDMIAAALSAFGKVGKTRGNLNNHIGVPLTLAALDGDEAFVVVELGMSAPGEIAALTALTAPHIRLVTRAAAAHLEFFRDVDAIADAKAEIFQAMPDDAGAVANADDPRVWARAQVLVPAERLVTYGRDDMGPRHVRVVASAHDEGRLVVSLAVEGHAFEVRLAALGAHNADNAAAAIATCRALDLDLARACAALSAGFSPAKHRLEWVRVGGLVVLDDCYNANPASTVAALDTFDDVVAVGSSERLAVLGSMRELGPTADALHIGVGAHAGPIAGMIIATGPHAEALADAARSAGANAIAVAEVPAAFAALDAWVAAHPQGAILLKGSRGEHLERALDHLQALASSEGGR